MQTIGLRKLADYGFEPPVQESAGKKEANKFSSIAGNIFMICFMLWVLKYLLNIEKLLVQCMLIVGKLKHIK